MVSNTVNAQAYPLRVVTQRLTSTSSKQLPHIVAFLASTIANCQIILSRAEGQGLGKDGSDADVAVHKLKTQLSALLQDKTIEARWSAVVLIKAVIEAGGWNVLQGCGSWVRGLLTILNKPDPPTTKELCLSALTRIFLLTQEHQSLVREITTPSIPPFVTSCLNIITLSGSARDDRVLDVTSPVLDTVLQVLIKLIPHHPSSVRPFVAQIRSLLAPILAPTPSDVSSDLKSNAVLQLPSSLSVALAQRLYAQLPQCAPKNTSNEEYNKYLRAIIHQVHRTADHVFRAIIEDSVLPTKLGTASANTDHYGEVVSDRVDDDLDLPGWSGVEAGCERLRWLLAFLENFIAAESSSAHTLPVGSIVSALERLLSVTAPDPQKSKVEARLNPEIGRDEREGMWLELPHIHISTIAVLSTLITRIDDTSAGVVQGTFEQVLWVYRHEHHSPELRISVYKIVTQMMNIIGPSLNQSTVTAMSPLIRMMCRDLLPTETEENPSNSVTNGSKKQPLKVSNADSYLQAPSGSIKVSTVSREVYEPTATLLLTILSKIPSGLLSVPIRSLLDRTAILLNDDKAMLASVLNPESRTTGKQISSILPFYTRSASGSLELEAILRPRMPVLQQKQTRYDDIDMEEEEDADLSLTSGANEVVEGDVMSAEEGAGGMTASEDTHDFLSAARRTRDIAAPQDVGTHPPSQLFTRFPTESSKRNREVVETKPTEELSITEPALPPNKRARLSDDETVDDVSLQAAFSTPFAPVYAPPDVPKTESTEPYPMPDRSTGADTSGDVSDQSDDSFEIPRLYLDSDSDEDEDEEEEEVDEKQKEIVGD